MKLIRFFAASLILAVMFTACSKDKDVAPSFNIIGYWEGKIGTDDAIPTGQFALQIKDGGKVDRISSDQSVSGTGTWTLNGTSFKAEYTASNGVTVKVSAILDKALGKLSQGKWENSGNKQGTWYASKGK